MTGRSSKHGSRKSETVLETTQPNMVNGSRVSNSQALVGFKCLTKCSGMPAMVASPLEVPHRLEVVHRMSLMS